MSGDKHATEGQYAPGAGSDSARIEHFAFDLNARVMIREIQRPGKVESLMIDYLGVQYRVAFWADSKRESVWLHADELEKR
jgi:hypothetical protein